MTTEDRSKPSQESSVSQHLTRPGGLSYLEIPSVDPHQSAAFYEAVLGWSIDNRDAVDIRFQDPGGFLIGRWVFGRSPWQDPGLLPYFYVNQIDLALELVVTNGGEIVKPTYPEGTLWVATVKDPTGNTIGLWQNGSR